MSSVFMRKSSLPCPHCHAIWRYIVMMTTFEQKVVKKIVCACVCVCGCVLCKQKIIRRIIFIFNIYYRWLCLFRISLCQTRFMHTNTQNKYCHMKFTDWHTNPYIHRAIKTLGNKTKLLNINFSLSLCVYALVQPQNTWTNTQNSNMSTNAPKQRRESSIWNDSS